MNVALLSQIGKASYLTLTQFVRPSGNPFSWFPFLLRFSYNDFIIHLIIQTLLFPHTLYLLIIKRG